MEPLFQIHLSPKLQRCIIFPPAQNSTIFGGFWKDQCILCAIKASFFSLVFLARIRFNYAFKVARGDWGEPGDTSWGETSRDDIFSSLNLQCTKIVSTCILGTFFNGIWRSTSKRSENGFLYKVTWSFSFPSYTNCHGNEPPQGGSAEFQRKPDKVIFKFLRAHFINVTLILKAEKSGLSRPACWLIAVQDGWPFDISKNRRQA